MIYILGAALAAICGMYIDFSRRENAKLAVERERQAQQASADRALREREIALAERKLELQATRSARPKIDKDMIPVDLLSDAMSESERWAREDKLKYLQDLREQSGSWDNVRSVVGVN